MACFGDKRTGERADWFTERVAATGSCVLRRVGGTRAGEMAAHRFLSSDNASVDAICDTLGARTAAAGTGRHVVCVQDTSEINFREPRGAAGGGGRRRGLGPGGDGATPGLFLHPLLAVDAEDEAVLGLLGGTIWTREATPAEDRRHRPAENKESRRWLDGARRADALLGGSADRVSVVGDRESDVFALFAGKPAGVDLVVRAAQNRALADGGRLFDALDGAPVTARRDVRVSPRGPGEAPRTARVALRARPVRLKRPDRCDAAKMPATVDMTLVEAREEAPPPGRRPLHWRLLCSADLDPAEAVWIYRLRWRVEQLFRTCKRDGLDLEATQMLEASRLFKLAALTLGAAARTLQLVDARDGSTRPAGDAVDEAMLPVLAAISTSLEGGTARQKNPHPRGSLAFVAWIAARLGGWNCYYRRPGPKTMRTGWKTLAAYLAGAIITQDLMQQNP